MTQKTMHKQKKEFEKAWSEQYPNGICKSCGLPSSEHDCLDFCPGGTEDFGGRR
jgi:hypothetical protein